MEAINKITTSVITWVLIASIGYLFVSIDGLKQQVLTLELQKAQMEKDIRWNEKNLQCVLGYGC